MPSYLTSSNFRLLTPELPLPHLSGFCSEPSPNTVLHHRLALREQLLPRSPSVAPSWHSLSAHEYCPSCPPSHDLVLPVYSSIATGSFSFFSSLIDNRVAELTQRPPVPQSLTVSHDGSLQISFCSSTLPGRPTLNEERSLGRIDYRPSQRTLYHLRELSPKVSYSTRPSDYPVVHRL